MGNVFSLFSSSDLPYLGRKAIFSEKSFDIIKKKIINYCKTLNGKEVLNLLGQLTEDQMLEIGGEFFYLTAKKFAKNQSIESYSRLLFILFKHYGFDA